MDPGECPCQAQQHFINVAFAHGQRRRKTQHVRLRCVQQQAFLQRALELVERCDCSAGCPACVGPVLAGDRITGGVEGIGSIELNITAAE